MGRKSRAKQQIEAPAAAAAPAPARPRTMAWSERELWVAAILLALNVLVFGQVAGHQFLNYDDGQFIYENQAVRNGLTPPSIDWALTSFDIGWYPLTWLSHELDVTLWGLKPAGHLLMQLLLHAASTLILFVALQRMTGATIRSGFVAALFAVHPMHVESVAWASERKDTLSTLFIVLALFVYAGREESRRKPVAVGLLLAASLMAKQMYVTFPFLLLVLDWWPLRRGVKIAEKLPLIGLSVAASLVALIGQRNLKALQSVEALPMTTRVMNALDGYGRYVGKLFWPTGLAVPYPMTPIGPTRVVAAVAVLAAITALAWFLRNRMPWLLTGWLWFAGTLVPVIGIIQIGAQSIADRYTYFAYIGLFLALVWSVAELVPARAAVAAGGAIVVVLAAIAWHQTRYWHDSVTLFTHTVDVTGDNPLAEYSIGQALQLTEPDRAIPHLERAVTLVRAGLAANPHATKPEWYAQSYVAMGTAKLMKARTAPASDRTALIASAEHDLHDALTIDPAAPHAANNLKVAAAMRQQLAGVTATPGANAADVNALIDAARAAWQQGRFDDAIADFRKAIDAAPQSVVPRVYLGLALRQTHRNAEAATALQEAAKIDPARANEVTSHALRLPDDPRNLERVVSSLHGE